jgi:hypothetical protein
MAWDDRCAETRHRNCNGWRSEETTMPTFPRFAVSLSVAATLSVAACTRDPTPGTRAAAAEGERLMREMSDTLARARVLRFATSESLETPGLPSERHVLHFTRSVTVRRPDAMRFEQKGTEGTNLDLAASYSGGMISLRDDVHGLWAQTAVPATLDGMLDDVARRFSFPVPFADVVYSVPYEAFVGPSTKGGFVGRETIGGVPCARLSYADDQVGVELWVPSSGPALPRRVELAYKRVAGAPKARIDFTRWDLSAEVAEAAFAFEPRSGSTAVPFEQFAAFQLSPGRYASAAPPTDAAAPR